MIRDPFYREIIERLDGPLHEEAFERCAQNLLRSIYPTLVAIRGGRDGGMDGVTADLDKNQIVLVATVGVNVNRNLRSSLRSMLANENSCRMIISATSQKISPEKQQELHETANDLGFRLVQVYEQAGMADLLYESPAWCMELLNLTGVPPPLSVIPRSGRPILTDVLIGRDNDARWLENAKCDRLLVGQPGSGKTFLLSALAKQHGWLFVVTREFADIANGIRSQKPTVLIVDDAHLDTEFLAKLKHLQRELDSDIPIIATCWPGAKDRVRESLNLTVENVWELRPLTRPEVASVLESAGLNQPPDLIYQILNQAEGRPGLAVTLAHLCIAGGECDLKEVLLGDALIRSVRTTYDRLVGSQVIETLAAFAVGGQAGVSMQVVADFLNKPIADIRLTVTGLSAGGVVNDVDGHHLSVRPPELRYGLIRDVFFTGAVSLAIEPLISRVPDLQSAAEVLADATHFGASISPLFLKNVLEHANSASAWKSYAWLGSQEARHALHEHPELLTSFAQPFLDNVPEDAIPLLLNSARDDYRPLHSNPNQPIRVIADWIKSGIPGTGEPARRREATLDATVNWIQSGGDESIGTHAICIALTPGFEFHTPDHVLGDTIRFRFGLLSIQELETIMTLWPRAFSALKTMVSPDWKYGVELISDWVYPQRFKVSEINSDMHSRMRGFAATMLRDVVSIGHESSGLMHVATQLASELGIRLEYAADPEFEVIFPGIPRNWSEFQESQGKAIRQLAGTWASWSPKVVIDRIEQLEIQALLIDEGNRQTPFLLDEIAKLVSNPLDWIEVILEADLRGDLVAPFLQELSTTRTVGWDEAALKCLSNESSRFSTASTILAMRDAPEQLLTAALQSLDGMSQQVKFLCMRNACNRSRVGVGNSRIDLDAEGGFRPQYLHEQDTSRTRSRNDARCQSIRAVIARSIG